MQGKRGTRVSKVRVKKKAWTSEAFFFLKQQTFFITNYRHPRENFFHFPTVCYPFCTKNVPAWMRMQSKRGKGRIIIARGGLRGWSLKKYHQLPLRLEVKGSWFSLVSWLAMISRINDVLKKSSQLIRMWTIGVLQPIMKWPERIYLEERPCEWVCAVKEKFGELVCMRLNMRETAVNTITAASGWCAFIIFSSKAKVDDVHKYTRTQRALFILLFQSISDRCLAPLDQTFRF